MTLRDTGFLIVFCGFLMGSLTGGEFGGPSLPAVATFAILEFVAPLYFVLRSRAGATRRDRAAVAMLLVFFAWGAGLCFWPFPCYGRSLFPGRMPLHFERAVYGIHFLFYTCVFLHLTSGRGREVAPPEGQGGRQGPASTRDASRPSSVRSWAFLALNCFYWSLLLFYLPLFFDLNHQAVLYAYQRRLIPYLPAFLECYNVALPRVYQHRLDSLAVELASAAIVFLPSYAMLLWSARVARRNSETPRDAVRKWSLVFSALLFFLWSGALALRFFHPAPPEPRFTLRSPSPAAHATPRFETVRATRRFIPSSPPGLIALDDRTRESTFRRNGQDGAGRNDSAHSASSGARAGLGVPW